MSNNTKNVTKGDAVWRGFRQQCPHCGAAPLFRAYLKPVEKCANCGEAFGHIRADDLPPYLTMVVVGHIVMPLFMVTDRYHDLSGWMHGAIWIPLTVALMFYFLPRLKGVALAWMWRIGLTGNETQGLESEK